MFDVQSKYKKLILADIAMKLALCWRDSFLFNTVSFWMIWGMKIASSAFAY